MILLFDENDEVLVVGNQNNLSISGRGNTGPHWSDQLAKPGKKGMIGASTLFRPPNDQEAKKHHYPWLDHESMLQGW